MSDKVYVDSCVFLSYFKNEPNADKCLGLFDSATKNELQIITSSITLTEVIKLKSGKYITESDRDKLTKFFNNNYILIANYEKNIALLARDLIWNYPHLNPKDAGHLATAISLNIPKLYSFDDHFLKLNNVIKDIMICEPDIPYIKQQSFV